MGLYENKVEIFGRLCVYLAPNGSTDLPSSGGSVNIGDLVINGNPAQVGIVFWQATAASPSPVWKAAGGGQSLRTTGVTGALSVTDGIVLLSAGGLTMTLPAATSWPIGKTITIKNTAGTSSTIATVSGNIDGSATFTLTTLSECDITSDGTNYWIIGK